MERAVEELRKGLPLPKEEGCNMTEFMDIVDLKRWQPIAARHGGEAQ